MSPSAPLPDLSRLCIHTITTKPWTIETSAQKFAALLPDCKAANVKLAIEPLHPMYADSRSAVNSLGQANDMVEALKSPFVGVAVDVYHVWWDPALETEIARCGRLKALLAYHVCDWRTPTVDLLN